MCGINVHCLKCQLNTAGINNYILGAQIGQGCFSAVHVATHKLTGADVAIKIVNKSLTLERSTLDNEIASLRLVRGHPHVVHVYEVFEDEGYLYIVMEYCAGSNLHNYLVANGPVDEATARRWFRQLVQALQYCHERNVISRDIKNANVLIDASGNVKLCDFGLSIVVSSAATEALWSPTGSAVFAAPEVYDVHNGNGYLGPPAEVWALGAVLHSMLAAVLPFEVKRYQRTWHHYVPPPGCTPEVAHLLCQIFQFQPCLRPVLSEILNHPWMLLDRPQWSWATLPQRLRSSFGRRNSQSGRASVEFDPCGLADPSLIDADDVLRQLQELGFSHDDIRQSLTSSSEFSVASVGDHVTATYYILKTSTPEYQQKLAGRYSMGGGPGNGGSNSPPGGVPSERERRPSIKKFFSFVRSAA